MVWSSCSHSWWTHDVQKFFPLQSLTSYSLHQEDSNNKWYGTLTFCHKEVEHGDDHCVTAEHVVTTCVDTCERHSKSTPDGQSSMQFCPHVTIYLGEREVSLLRFYPVVRRKKIATHSVCTVRPDCIYKKLHMCVCYDDIILSLEEMLMCVCTCAWSCSTFPEHCRCCPGTDREVTNMVMQRSMNTVPMRLHSRRSRMDLKQSKHYTHINIALTTTSITRPMVFKPLLRHP